MLHTWWDGVINYFWQQHSFDVWSSSVTAFFVDNVNKAIHILLWEISKQGNLKFLDHEFGRPITSIHCLDSKTLQNACFQTANNTPYTTGWWVENQYYKMVFPAGGSIGTMLSSTLRSFQFNISSVTYTLQSILFTIYLIMPLICAGIFHMMQPF